MRGLIRLLLVAGAIAGLWWLLRELLDQPSESTDAPREEGRVDEGPTRTEASPASTNGAGSPSKAELYLRAQELDVKGRSKMNKQELAAAVARAQR